MAITYPYALSALADRLNIESVTWDIQRNDELSGTGDGRVWQAELAPPLWTADVKLNIGYHDDLKQIAARVRKLHGAQELFWLYDPLSKYPQADPDGSILGASTVRVNSIGTGGRTISLKGLPAGYVLTLADKLQIAYATSPVRNAFLEVSDDIVSASGSGVTGLFEVFPNAPTGVAANDVVTLVKPACKVFISPGTANPGSGAGLMTSGAGFKVIEKR
jgi:hypothetical protein